MDELKPCPDRKIQTENEYRQLKQDIATACKIIANAINNILPSAVDRGVTPENKPLTLDELRKMDGEPVYIVYPTDPSANHWEIIYLVVQQYDANGKPIGDEWVRMTSGASERADAYGKTWLAYARKPEQEAHP